MRRREFVALLSSAAGTWPLGLRAQQGGRIYKVAIVNPVGPTSRLSDPKHPLWIPFIQTLRDLGYVEGQNLILVRRSAEGIIGRAREIGAALVRDGVDVIVVNTTVLAKDMMGVTSAVPIVMAASVDPIGLGVVSNLARPGGNVTGFSNQVGPEM